MANECILCKKKFGLFNQANFLCDDACEMCDSCFANVKIKYNDYLNVVKTTKNLCVIDEKAKGLLQNVYDSNYGDDICGLFDEWIKDNRKKIEQSINEAEERAKQIGIFSQLSERELMAITTTPSLEGYDIEKYLGIVTGEAVLGTGALSEFFAATADLFGTNSVSFSNKVGAVKQEALNNMKRDALQKGASAVVGVHIEINVTNANMFIASANGTAVVLKPNGCDLSE